MGQVEAFLLMALRILYALCNQTLRMAQVHLYGPLISSHLSLTNSNAAPSPEDLSSVGFEVAQPRRNSYQGDSKDTWLRFKGAQYGASALANVANAIVIWRALTILVFKLLPDNIEIVARCAQQPKRAHQPHLIVDRDRAILQLSYLWYYELL